MSTQQQANTGDYCCIIQVIGDHNTVGNAPHLKIHCPSRQRLKATEPAKDDAFLLRPVIEATEFVGRADLIEDFVSWAHTHDTKRPVSVRVVHGGAGVGKTRFARELCRALGPDWQAGFVDGQEARRFLGQINLSNWGWQKPTLVVFDYALSLVDILPDWFDELCAIPSYSYPLRLLLLEREAQEDNGWLAQIFSGEGFGATPRRRRDLLGGEAPLLLPEFNDPISQRRIMEEVLTRMQSSVALPPDDAVFRKLLAGTDWAGAPLYLMMAAIVTHRQGYVGEVFNLRRVDLAQAVEDHEYKRLKLLCRSRSWEILLEHMAAYATLCGGLSAEMAERCLAEEKTALNCDGVELADALEKLVNVLPDGDDGVAPVQPDIVGEAFLLRHLGNSRSRKSGEAVARAFRHNPVEVATVLVRCVQDFVPTKRAPLSGRETDAQDRALEWLRSVGDLSKLPLPFCYILIDALPDKTEALRVLAWDWQSQCVERLRVAPDTVENRSKLAASLNNLAIRCRHAGRRDDGIDAARQSVSIRREQVLLQPDRFLPALALSLTTLAICLSHAGRKEEALSPAQDAVEIRRELFSQRPNLFRKELANSLHILSIVLGGINRSKEALLIACEMTDMFIELEYTDKIFFSSLAASFVSLSNRLSETDNSDEAITVGCEAVSIYRELVAEHPDACRPDLAMSLNNIADKLCKKGTVEKALPFSLEAVSIYRELATDLPAAFKPCLAMSLSTLTNVLRGIAPKRKEALAVVKEATGLYRSLMQKQPDVFRDDFQEAMATWLALAKNISLEKADVLLKEDFSTHSRDLINELNRSDHLNF